MFLLHEHLQVIILVQVNEAKYGKLKLRKELHKEINRLNHE